MSKVSVIMPAYNVEQYIAASIDSVIRQTYPHWELLVVNDGSSDNTLNVINELAKTDSRIKVITQENQGVSVARNVALAQAAGEYITFLDGDDVYLDTYLEKMVDRIQTGNCDAVYCGQYFMKGNIEHGQPYAEGNILECYGLHKQHISIIAFLIKKSFLDQHNLRFVPGRKIAEDQELILLCGVYNCTVKAVPEVLVQYVYNTGSVTSGYMSWQKYKDNYLAKSRVFELIHEHFESAHKEAICQHFHREKQLVLISFKKNLWSTLKAGNIDAVYRDMCEYGRLENLETKKKFIHGIEVAILNTKNKTLWKLIAWPLNTLKNIELALKGKRKTS